MTKPRCLYCGHPERAVIHMSTYWGGHRYVKPASPVRDVVAGILWVCLMLLTVLIFSGFFLLTGGH